MKYDIITDGKRFALRRKSFWGGVRIYSFGGYWWTDHTPEYFYGEACWYETREEVETVLRRIRASASK